MPDPIDRSTLWAAVGSFWGGPLEWHASVDSTNRLLAERARAGAPEGTIIGADHQTEGRGRRGRTWQDEPGTSLAMSLLLRPSCAPADVGLVAVLAAIGVAGALQDLSGAPADIVWPNDVLLDAAKTSGVLCESSLTATSVGWVVVGIGVNVGAVPKDVGGRWTPGSLAAAGFGGSRHEAASAVLGSVARAYREWEDEGPERLLSAFADRDALRGRELVVSTPDGEVRGRGSGIDAFGRLLVTSEGATLALAAGDVVHVDR